jgi:predicted Zn finger-like uncharacterized protein
MRIVCQKCSAAYAIDDRLISPKGVRAQCPRCRNLQLVKRDPSAPASAAPEAAPAAAVPPPQAAPAAPSASADTSGDDSDLFDFGSPPPGLPAFPKEEGLFGPPSKAPAPAQAAAPTPAPAADPLLDFLGPPPSVPETSSPGPAPSTPRRASSPGVASVAPGAQRRPSSPGLASAANAATATSGCRECGKALTDPFDQALGVCDACRALAEGSPRSGRAGAPQFEPPPPAMSTPPAVVPASELRNSRPPSRVYAPPSMPARSAQRSGGGRGLLIGGLVAGLLLGGGAGAYYYFFHLKPQQVATAAQQQPQAPAALPEAVQAVLPRWQLKYLDISGTSAELVAEGNAQLQKDQRFAYAEAEESFQQALLQDPRNDAAIAGYVQALALGRGTGMDDATFQEARGLIEAAESRAGRTPPLVLAHANLLLARPRQPQHHDQARQLAEQAMAEGSNVEKAEANLVLGRVFMSTSMGLAHKHFDTALELAPDLRRVHYFRALAYESAGQYAQALEGLKKRLDLDPQHWDSLEATGRMYQELGEVDQARDLYAARLKAQPKDFRAQLALAALRYQTEASASGAVKDLNALLKNRASYPPRDVAEALVHLSIAERLAGSADASAKAAAEALQLEPTLSAAHVQLFLVALGKGDAAKAGTHLTAMKGQLDDPALEKVLEGRLLLLQGKHLEAAGRFQEASKLDERRHDALLLAGVAAAKEKRRDEAFRPLFQALGSDPLRPAPRPVATLFYVRPEDTLKGAEGAIVALADGEEDVVPRLYEGVLRFHQGEWAAAERLFKQVTSIDEDNAGATAYLSLLALQRGNKAAARSLGEQAVAVGRQAAIAHLAHGLALAEANKVEPAKRALRDALALAPKLLSAEVKLAELEAASDRESARARLVKVVGLDSTYHTAKRVLFTLDRRG